jgi:hypothetical protein
MLPIAIMQYSSIYPQAYGVAILANMLIHGIVDDMKANRKKINLIVDQLIHLAQVVITWLCFVQG